ncbi:hypothetical protein OIU74_027991 [Salix koriyanagi]|nr:hypothetical protein OIU74_027991 [Salix koriyanagi]
MTASYPPATQDSIALASKAEDPFEAISILHKIPETPSSSPDALRVKEQAGLNYIWGRELVWCYGLSRSSDLSPLDLGFVQNNSDCLRVLFGWSASHHNLFIPYEINSTSYLII